MSDMSGLAGINQKILELLKVYCRIPSITGSPGEALVPAFIEDCLSGLPYFRANPDHLGSWKVENDSLNRQVAWAMIRGGSDRTVVLIHHSDVVVTDNFAHLKNLALDIEQLQPALKADPGILNPEAKQDLASGDWLFGRGAADMKGGGAIQLALFDAYARLDENDLTALPTLVLMALPDEENLSAGMRSGLGLLCQLRNKYDLKYQLMINSEPHQRLTLEKGLISQGSIGKLNLFVYVRGVMAHAGKVLEGINPTGLMARVVSETDLSSAFIDKVGQESSIPPTWILVRDLKKQYDISFPEACYGIFNVLNFSTGPGEVMGEMTKICKESLTRYIGEVNKKRAEVASQTGKNWQPFTWEARVVSYDELQKQTTSPLNSLSLEDELAFRTQDFHSEEPLIVVGLCPPYYPGVTNSDQKTLANMVNGFSRDAFGQEYDTEPYYTGISDLSYAMATGDAEVLSMVMANMADKNYHIPFEQIEQVSMNCINIGPWGKDFHKPSERVLKEDLLHRTPMIIDHIIRNYRI